MAKTKQLYEDNGVEVSKTPISVGDEVTLLYSGLLAKSGAEMVYAHIGYGDNWEEKAFIPMQKDNDVFKATIKVNHPDSLNIAFKDSGENWDNNSHSNYSFKVAKKAAKASKEAEEAKAAKEVKEKATAKAAEKTVVEMTAAAKKTTAAAAKKTATKKTATKKTTEK